MPDRALQHAQPQLITTVDTIAKTVQTGRAVSQTHQTQKYARLLSNVDLFSGLDRVTLSKLAAHLETQHLAEGETLMREGEVGDGFYLVADGSLGVFVTPNGGIGETRVQTLGSGEPVGEMALLTNAPRSATVRATTDAELLHLHRADFVQLVSKEPSVSLAIAAKLCRRLRDTQSNPDRRLPPAETPRDDRAATRLAAAAPARKSLLDPSLLFNQVSLSIALACAILLAGWQVAPPSGLSGVGWHALVIFIAFLPAIALAAIPEGVVALALIATWVIADGVPTTTAMAGFASANWVLVVCLLVVGSAVASTGLLYRLALWSVARFPDGFGSQILALATAGLLMGPTVPHATGRVMFLAPLIQELVEALGYKPQGRAATGLAMAALIGFGKMVAAFMTSSTTAILVFALVQPTAPKDLSWLTWAIYGLPMTVVIFLGTIGAIVWLYRPAQKQDEGRHARRVHRLELQRALLGAPSRHEWLAAVTGIGLLLGFVSQPWHGLHPAWVTVAALVVLAATGVATVETMRTINWSFALMFGIIASMAGLLTSLGVDKWLGSTLSALIGNLADEPLAFVVALTLLCFVLSLFVRWPAAAPLVTIVFGPVAASAGINPLVVGLVATVACNPFFLPYQSTTYLALYHGTGGRLFTHAQARPVAWIYAVAVLVAVCVSVPFWRLMGLV